MDGCPINPNDMGTLFALIFVALALLLACIIILVKAWIYCMVFHKAGYGWAWGLLILVPIANIIIPFVLALGDWPVRRELRQLKESAKMPA